MMLSCRQVVDVSVCLPHQRAGRPARHRPGRDEVQQAAADTHPATLKSSETQTEGQRRRRRRRRRWRRWRRPNKWSGALWTFNWTNQQPVVSLFVCFCFSSLKNVCFIVWLTEFVFSVQVMILYSRPFLTFSHFTNEGFCCKTSWEFRKFDVSSTQFLRAQLKQRIHSTFPFELLWLFYTYLITFFVWAVG